MSILKLIHRFIQNLKYVNKFKLMKINKQINSKLTLLILLVDTLSLTYLLK